MESEGCVLLIGNYLPDDQPSMLRYAQVLADRLPRCGLEVRMVRPEPCIGRFVRGSAAKWFGYVDKFVVFPTVLRRELVRLKRRPDQVLAHVCDHGYAMYVRALLRERHLVTCHDLLAVRSARGEIEQNPTRWSGRRLQAWIADGLKRAQHVVCVSEYTQHELHRVCGVPLARTTVIHNGFNGHFAPLHEADSRSRVLRLLPALGQRKQAKSGGMSEAERQLRPYVLHVGAECWYKNRLGVVRAYSAMAGLLETAPDLVMVGPAPNQPMQRLIAERNLKHRVHSVPQCDHEDLRALYCAAELLLFPSWEEGFGWPIIEAQACGCRVVTSNRQPMMEVGGDGALYADPSDTRALASAMVELLGADREARGAQIERSAHNAERFSTERMIGAYAQLYRRLMT